MTTKDKTLARLKTRPKDFTYQEAKSILLGMGFVEFSKGKTSGSRVAFVREDNLQKFLLHKPHPGDVLPYSTTKNLADFIERLEVQDGK